MYKKYFILFFILLTFVALFYYRILLNVITGLLTTIGISIASITTGEFIYFSYPSEVTLGDSATFETTFENTGNLNVTVAIEIHVLDSSLNTVTSSYDNNYTLRMGDTRNFSATWTPTATGTYWVIVNASFNSSAATNSTEENASFSVVSAEVVPVVEAPAGRGGGAPAKVITYNLTLEYPESVTLTQGESSIIPIYATNYGDTDLNNLLLSVSLEGIEWEIEPENVSILPVNSTAMFYISVLVSSDALSKNYTLNFTLKSNEVRESGQIIIKVYPIELCEEVERAINNYEALIDRATAEIEKAIAEGRNVTSTLAYLFNAKEELELAKRFYASNDCGEAKVHLELVKENLKKLASELAKSIKPRVKYVIIKTWWIIGIIFFVIALILPIFILIAKRRKRVKYVTKPMIIILKEKREKQKKNLRDLKKSYTRKQISENTYNRKKTEIEKEIVKIEEQILTQFGSERQKTVFKDLKKAYTEGIINRKTYNLTRQKLVNNIISKQKPKG